MSISSRFFDYDALHTEVHKLLGVAASIEMDSVTLRRNAGLTSAAHEDFRGLVVAYLQQPVAEALTAEAILDGPRYLSVAWAVSKKLRPFVYSNPKHF